MKAKTLRLDLNDGVILVILVLCLLLGSVMSTRAYEILNSTLGVKSGSIVIAWSGMIPVSPGDRD